jgi:hypothetical protein
LPLFLFLAPTAEAEAARLQNKLEGKANQRTGIRYSARLLKARFHASRIELRRRAAADWP